MVVILPGKLSPEDQRRRKACSVGTAGEVSKAQRTGRTSIACLCPGVCSGVALSEKNIGDIFSLLSPNWFSIRKVWWCWEATDII